ncbi:MULTISPECIES: HAMP domain-containing sensor histidine kinase [unclassified Enterococcus]|uniref:HAMP domain-containing sensor histidine kinase n=1 Tax=unclassified Enterococcus TaxID=2608891 RepID=UPI0015520D22|nr:MULTISPECIES: HAMP domain-containing sensor histidine kinase [unclassified Enterococcus]MBS7578103.1 HAMP domain-containing histidine kinase [Enterococcus sp. MMGLQ5-2]MBS7585363.1 HAMP domain-containing histidine kinase [Enterococcus sp. MMGLQ5-1]NPD13220.1 HAMP domain-containing histidine kinase [Enterococcus sp. MMGLQ5-1]NPD37934.1 HAMP domain-containing histidine kinase [Enterococcus sp. MMGLQ5-2]
MKSNQGRTTFPRETLNYLFFSAGLGILTFVLLFFSSYFLYNQVIQPNREAKLLATAVAEFQSYVTEHQVDSNDQLSWQSSDGTVIYLRNQSKINQSGSQTPPKNNQPVDSKRALSSESQSKIKYSDAQVVSTFLVVNNKWPFYIITIVVIIIALSIIILNFYRLLLQKARYMNEIEKGTLILESGDLSYRIPELGNDELSQIASSINEMSASLSDKITSEANSLQASRELIGDLSHDIRTPLTILTGYLPLLLESELTKQQRQYLELIQKKTNQIRLRVDELLDYATISSGQQPLNLTTINVSNLIRQFEQELKPIVAVHLNNRLIGEVLIVGDQSLLDRLFDNLVSNIRQHGDLTESVQIEVYEHNQQFCLEVRNKILLDDEANSGKSLGVKIGSMIANLHQGNYFTEANDFDYTTKIILPINNE